ncbi:MAG: hypothetical protein E7417_06045 [Ruminococcaceae bacterium]|nr:hypothetical protein [Oscillospiraceae bacterium]
MARITYPNQRVVNIHREPINTDFLGIKNENWQYAARDLKPFGCMLYLYLAANRDNFKLALSPAAVRQAIGMAQSTYRDQFSILLEKGYLVQTGGNTFDFYEKPRAATNVNQDTRHATTQGEKTADLMKNQPAANDIDLANIEINNSDTFLYEDINNEEDYINENELYDEWIGANEPSNFEPIKGQPKQGDFVF